MALKGMIFETFWSEIFNNDWTRLSKMSSFVREAVWSSGLPPASWDF